MFHSIKKPHYAWIICLCGLWLFVTNMGLCSNILSVYLPFIEGTGLSDSMGSAILSIRCLSSFAATFVVERYYRRLGLRRGIFIASLFGVASALVYSIGGSAFVYYTGAVLGGICYGLGAIYPSALMLTRWFHTHRGLAIGISSAGSGVSIMIFSPVVSALVLRYSLQTTFLLQAGFMLISAACVFLLLRDDPAQKGLSPYGEGGVSSVKAREQEGPAQLPALVMWMLALMMLLIGGAGQAFSGHLSVLARSCGYTVRAAATVVSLQGMVLVCSKLLSGGVADRFGPRRCTTLLIAIFLLGCAAVQFMNGVSLFWCFVPPCLMGFGASVYNVGPPLWAGDLSDKAGYPKLLKWLQIFYNLGGILFSAVPGIIADHTGEYKSSYILIAGMMLVSLLILLWSYRRVLGDRSDA
ncbi:MAG: MFS transporter [Clostridia bacterium]|nr:MFS transporter [Clostridia bacterium]